MSLAGLLLIWSVKVSATDGSGASANLDVPQGSSCGQGCDDGDATPAQTSDFFTQPVLFTPRGGGVVGVTYALIKVYFTFASDRTHVKCRHPSVAAGRLPSLGLS